MRALGLNFLSVIIAAVFAIGAADMLGLEQVGSMLLLGICIGLAPHWSMRPPKPAPSQASALVIDPTGEIAYLRVREGTHGYTVADVEQVNADFDKDGNLLGVEFVVWPLDDRPAVPQAWPPYDGYEDEDEDDNDNEGEEWKQ